MAGLESISPIGMAGLQVGAKAVDGLIDLGMSSLNEALWGDYYRDKEVEQSQRLLDQQVAGQKELQAEQAKHQLNMWNATNYGAQTKHMEAAGLNPALMYGQSSGGGTTAGSVGSGQATASGAGKQQLLHDRTTPIDIAEITVAAAQAKKLKAEADNLDQDT